MKKAGCALRRTVHMWERYGKTLEQKMYFKQRKNLSYLELFRVRKGMTCWLVQSRTRWLLLLFLSGSSPVLITVRIWRKRERGKGGGGGGAIFLFVRSISCGGEKWVGGGGQSREGGKSFRLEPRCGKWEKEESSGCRGKSFFCPSPFFDGIIRVVVVGKRRVGHGYFQVLRMS